MNRSLHMTPVDRLAARILLLSDVGLLLTSRIMGVNVEAVRRIRRKVENLPQPAGLLGAEHERLTADELGLPGEQRLIFLTFVHAAVVLLALRMERLRPVLTADNANAFAAAVSGALQAMKVAYDGMAPAGAPARA